MNAKARVLGIGIALCSATALGGPENVKWPADYKSAFLAYYTGDRIGNDQQEIRIYANRTAIDGYRADGKLPYGSVLVGELYGVKLDPQGQPRKSLLGRRIADKLAAIVVMERGRGFDEGYPAELKTGDWEFAVFSPTGERLDKEVAPCRQCHHPLESTEFLFSYDHLGG